jgi:hypothetical protein
MHIFSKTITTPAAIDIRQNDNDETLFRFFSHMYKQKNFERHTIVHTEMQK